MAGQKRYQDEGATGLSTFVKIKMLLSYLYPHH